MPKKLKQEISNYYLEKIEKLNEENDKKRTQTSHFRFYCWIFSAIFVNGIAASSWEIGWFKYGGFKDWGASISLLVPEVIFFVIYGARSGIDHLERFLDKIVSIRR
jgi:hypothetical protein